MTGLVLAAAAQWERNRAPRALRQSEERLRLALDRPRGGTWFWSLDSNILILIGDENLGRPFGRLPHESASRYGNRIQRVPPDDRAIVDASVRRARVQGGGLDNEFRALLAAGRGRWIASQARCLRHQ
jgi:PAS domain-containing protein